MKKLICLFLLINSITFGQTDCDNNIITKSAAPSNGALPLIGGQPDTRYLNHFDWFPIGEVGTPDEGLYMGYNLTNMNFAGTPITSMSNIMSAQGTSPNYSYIFNGRLPLTENGWELLLVNVGRYPDNTTILPPLTTDLRAFPYIVIYNRYTGIIRVFCMFGLDRTVFDAANAIEISLEYSTANYSGLMRLYEGRDQALDQKTDVKKMTSVATAENYGNKWYSTDFQIAYDPCQCYYPSKLRLGFTQIKGSSIEAHWREITQEKVPIIDSTTLTVNPSDWLTGFDYTGETASGGVAMAKSLKIMTNRYIAELEKYKTDLASTQVHNDEVEKKIVIMKLFEKVIVNGGSSAIASLMGMPWWADLNKFASHLLKKDYIDEESLKEEGKKALASGAKSLKTLVLGEIKPLPSKPEIPTATFSEASFTGKITQKNEYTGPVFYAPGTYGSVGTGKPTLASVSEYPVYNDVLGTFALLESPKIRVKELISNFVENLAQGTIIPAPGVYDLGIQRYQSWSKTYQIELVDNLKYAFNSTLDIKKYTIKTAFIIKAKPKMQNVPNDIVMNCFQNTNTANSSITNLNVSAYGDINTCSFPYNYYNIHPNTNFDFWSKYSKFMTFKTVDVVEIETPFLPIDAFKPLKTRFGIKNEAISYKRNYLYNFDLVNYKYTQNGGVYNFDLNDPHINLPSRVDMNSYNNGYMYDLEVELKMIIDIEFNTIDNI